MWLNGNYLKSAGIKLYMKRRRKPFTASANRQHQPWFSG